MVQGGSGQSFRLKTAQPVGIQRKRPRENLNGYFALKTRVTGAIYLTRPARTKRRNDLIRSESGTGSQVHR